jgi:RsiW-degrading membrane proteinase PrsW (M82 family)
MRRLGDYEPWKLVIGAFLSGAATVGALVGLLTFILK